MKENELRIGNYVFSADDNKNGEVFQIDPSGIIFVNKNGNRWQDLKNIQPIPLTEEILFKCGFKKDHDKLWIDNGVFEIEYLNGQIGLTCGLHAEESMPLDIKYLHQLQNLYFALTDIELEMNL